MNKKKLAEQEQAILRKAEENGLECDYLFSTTFERYRRQLKTLEALEKEIENSGTLVTKEYVKGRGNVYIHPAVAQYDRTADSANKTVSTLLRIFKNFGVDDAEEEIDPLLDILNGDESQSV